MGCHDVCLMSGIGCVYVCIQIIHFFHPNNNIIIITSLFVTKKKKNQNFFPEKCSKIFDFVLNKIEVLSFKRYIEFRFGFRSNKQKKFVIFEKTKCLFFQKNVTSD